MGRHASIHFSGASGSQRDEQEAGHTALQSNGAGELTCLFSSDLWALGCILYQMIAGRFAFVGLSEYLTWQKIKALDYSFPDGFDEQAKDLVSKLLVSDSQAFLKRAVELPSRSVILQNG